MIPLRSNVSAGFTLIEVMVVIAIAAVLLSIAVPSFFATTQRFRTLGEINSFAHDLQFARTEAIKQGVPVSMCASSDGVRCLKINTWHKGWIVFTDAAAALKVDALLRVQPGWTNTDTLLADNAVFAFTFSRDGYTIGLPGTGTVTATLQTTPLNSAATQCLALIKTGRQQVLPAGPGCG
ncbi:putative type-4 fimbrial pilin related signal peptide protein [Oxalobacteraceae bacterium IMCC9480]|jgi:type IV fimbrial biogenesis protein FimT|nr:putative type-4 fimbrial pilin related signal peptide protein [Oxalobacteraceae bacterium IMCC9480]NDP58980.1 prepilin-type N-terminal cleavage/methylation domain-containing protein [Oxalobacteraceae bacterium]